jgi:hypothetical protein
MKKGSVHLTLSPQRERAPADYMECKLINVLTDEWEISDSLLLQKAFD